MGNVLIQESTMTAIADSIREKNGLNERYLPSAMPDAIRNISTSSDTEPSEDDPIRFYGHEGKLLYSYSLEEIKALTELPRLPEVEGLICQGWNWSLENLQSLNREMDVGAMFITDDGATRIYIYLNEDLLDPMLGFYQSVENGVAVDWGDGSELEYSEIYGVTVFDSMAWFSHQYKNPGEYMIRLIPKDDAIIRLAGASNGSYLLRKNTSSYSENIPYSAAIQKIELGKNIMSISANGLSCKGVKSITLPSGLTTIEDAFSGNTIMNTITIPKGVTKISTGTFESCTLLKLAILPDSIVTLSGTAFKFCYHLKRIRLPEGITTIGTGAFIYCYSLDEMILPSSVSSIADDIFYGCAAMRKVELNGTYTKIPDEFFYNCRSMKEIVIPEGITDLGKQVFNQCNLIQNIQLPTSLKSIGAYCFQYCYSLSRIIIPPNVVSIGNYAFQYCYGATAYYMLPETPPVLGGGNVFNNIYSTCKIYVPKGCLEAYQTADYWSTYADYMVEMEGEDEETE